MSTSRKPPRNTLTSPEGRKGYVKCANDHSNTNMPRRPAASIATRTPRPGLPRIWYGAKKNASADPSRSPDKRVSSE